VEGASDTVRHAFDAWNRADWETVLSLMQPDIELDGTDRVLNPAVYRGRDGFMQFVTEVFEVWEEWRMDLEEAIEVDDRVFLAVRSSAKGKTSGLALDEVAYQVWTLREGRAQHISFHYDREKALATARGAVTG
jgi:ketosteroid isomerase-like protein